MTYRPDIDGLRAIAVLPVMLFHAGSDLFSGGFVGVDVFFVISGFLITGIILTELQQGRFSVAGFYERRARRLLPALFVVMAVCLPFAWLWMYPPALQDFAQSLLAVATFSSNLLFWQETGYWGSANELKPLLHTWSLAVEEQYYVLFPLFLLALWRWRINTLLPILMLLAVASLLLAEWGSHRYPEATFFLLPTRGWELAMGAITACVFIRHQDFIKRLRGHRGLNEGLSVLGLSLIMFAVFGFDRHTPFPGLWALIPTVGTALVIIFCSPMTHTARLLGSRLLAGIGLISYSAYLWHQPLLAFTRHRSLTDPEESTLILMALLSLPLAYLSWRLIEQPFRNKQRVSRQTVVWFAVVGSVVFMAIGLAGHLQQGWPISRK